MARNTTETQVMSGEWSYLVDEDDIAGNKLVRLSLSPSEEEKAALCQRLGLISMEALRADLELRRKDGGMVVEVRGTITADVTQKCVATLEPVPEHIEEEFEAWFADPDKAVSFAKARRERMSHKEKEDAPFLEEYDDPEPIVNGRIDLGELSAQYLSLFLNPYPRAEGSPHLYAEGEDERSDPDQYKNPFAALKDWKDRGGRKGD